MSKKKASRSENPDYADRNRMASARNNFQGIAAVRWLRANMPEVMAAINAEAEKRWPKLRRQESTFDYSFVGKIKANT